MAVSACQVVNRVQYEENAKDGEMEEGEEEEKRTKRCVRRRWNRMRNKRRW